MFWAYVLVMVGVALLLLLAAATVEHVWWTINDKLSYEQDRLLLLSLMIFAIIITVLLGLPVIGRRVLVPVTWDETKVLENMRK